MSKRRKPSSGVSECGFGSALFPVPDPTTLFPDALCDKTRQALALVPVGSQSLWYEKLMTGLQEAGVNVTSALFSLGILVRVAAELTPSDIGKLLRYVRINRPEAIAVLAAPLAQLLSTVSDGPPMVVQNASKAA